MLQPLTPQTADDVEDMLAIEHMTVHGALASGIGCRDLSINIFFMFVLLVCMDTLVSTVRVATMCN